MKVLETTYYPNLGFKDVLTEMWFGGDAGLSKLGGFCDFDFGIRDKYTE